MNTSTRLVLALLSGVLDPLGFTGFGLFPLTWVAKVPILLAVHDLPPLKAFKLAMVYGIIACLGGYYWLVPTFSEFGGLPAFVAWLGTVGVCAYLGLSFGILISITQFFRAQGLAPVWSLAAVYPAIELLFPNIFPYNIGASQYRFTAITQIVEITGLLGLTTVIALVNGAVYELVESRWQHRTCLHRRWIVALGVFLLVVGYGLLRLNEIDYQASSSRHLKTALIQPNQDIQTQRNASGSFRKYSAMTRSLATEGTLRPDLVVWPETAIRLPLHREATALPDAPTFPLLTGAITHSDEGRAWNTLLASTPIGGITSRYDKRVLLPFGEMIPFENQLPWLRKWLPQSGKLTAGNSLNHLHAAGATFLPTICYEDTLASGVRQIWQHAGPAHALVNVTNDSWFGDTHEPRTHLALATFRAIETRRSLIRSSVTGISALVDPAGRIVAQIGLGKQDILVGSIPLIEDNSTTFYLRHGEWFGWLCVAISSIAFVRSKLRKTC